MPSNHHDLFSGKDVDILSHGVSIFPNLEFACFATTMAREHLQFPITSPDAVFSLFSAADLPARIEVRQADLQRFLPKELFPIDDARDFLGKILGALSWADVVLGHERFLANPAQFSPVPYGKVG